MEHPQRFLPGDALVQRVRELCLALPEATEVEAWGCPTFRVAKKIFAHLSESEERAHALIFKTDAEEHLALQQDPRFFHPGYYDRAHWLATGLDGADADWGLIEELIETSYRQVALKRQLALLDGARPA